MENIWKEIPEIEGIGAISSEGLFKFYNWNRTGKEKITKGTEIDDGYYLFNLFIQGQSKHILAHRLVAIAFVPIPDKYKGIPIEYLVVHHCDENPSNNNFNNLRWMTVAEHKAIHASKAIEMLTLDWEHEAYFPSAAEAYRQTGISASSISQLCNGTGKRKSAGTKNGKRHRFRHCNAQCLL